MQLGLLRRAAIDDLDNAGVESGRICVDWLLCDILGMSGAQVVASPEFEVPALQEREFREGVRRRAAGEPIQYIVGWTEFFGLRIAVRRGALIPRPETEIVVEEVLSLTVDGPACRILDLGTGSGCIALAIKSRRPQATVVACDISETAVQLARSNSERLGLEVAVRAGNFERGESLGPASEKYDVLVSNPPYVPISEFASLPKEVVEYEPHEALLAEIDPLRYYRALIDRTIERVVKRGVMVVEVHTADAEAVTDLAEQRGLKDVRVRPDLAGLPRVVSAVRG